MSVNAIRLATAAVKVSRVQETVAFGVSEWLQKEISPKTIAHCSPSENL